MKLYAFNLVILYIEFFLIDYELIIIRINLHRIYINKILIQVDILVTPLKVLQEEISYEKKNIFG